MSFVTASALAIALLIAAPIAAHLLRRGRTPEQVFPPVALVRGVQAHSHQRARLRDPVLLTLRAAAVLLLAVLGATPLVQCSRLNVQRPGGASVALALVLDDSHSMRARTRDGRSRWRVALSGARELVDSLRDGDAVAIVLAGHPARLSLAATTDRDTARAALELLEVSDRPSDTRSAVRLARSTLESLQQPTHQLVVLSDLAGAGALPDEAQVPLPELRTAVDDCGIVAADTQNHQLTVEIACSEAATRVRTLKLREPADPNTILQRPEAMSGVRIAPQEGSQTLTFALATEPERLALTMLPADDNPENDDVEVSRASARLQVAVVGDRERGKVLTGGGTVIEQALAAVRPNVALRPLSALPDATQGLSHYAAVLIDDPSGLPPSTRLALEQWLQEGGVCLGLLGPSSASLQLSASLEPFAERSARWQPLSQPAGASRPGARESSSWGGSASVGLGVDAASLAWLGPAASTLGSVARKGRMRLDGAQLDGAEVVGRWEDGVPFLLARAIGSGLVLTVGLPSSLDVSDMGLRPAFLSLLDYVVEHAVQRRGPGTSTAGDAWPFVANVAVDIRGPGGPVPFTSPTCGDSAACGNAGPVALPTLAGRYEVTVDGKTQVRMVRVPASEITEPPGAARQTRATTSAAGEEGAVDATPNVALLLLGLLTAEIGLRAWRRKTDRPAAV